MIRVLILSLSLAAGACSQPEQPAATSPQAGSAPAATSAVVSGKAPRGAIVMLTTASGTHELPPGPVVMDQISKTFVPEVLVARVGQPVEFRNSEEMEHNVIVVKSRTGRGVFNEAPSPFEKYVHTFQEVGVYSVSCDIHPGMKATVVVTPTPYTAVTDNSGAFSFANVPPGSYRLSVLSDRGDSERAIDVKLPKTEVVF